MVAEGQYSMSQKSVNFGFQLREKSSKSVEVKASQIGAFFVRHCFSYCMKLKLYVAGNYSTADMNSICVQAMKIERDVQKLIVCVDQLCKSPTHMVSLHFTS